MAKDTHYDILGVSRTATEEEIKHAYRTLAREFHPDVNQNADAESRFKEINLAYATLSDSLKRADYDQTLADTGVRGAAAAAGAGAASGGQTPTEGGYDSPYRRAQIRAGLARTTVAGLMAAGVGVVLQLLLALAAESPITATTLVLGALPAAAVGALYGADMNFKVETFLGTGWLGRSYTLVRTILMSLGLGYYAGLIGAAGDQLLETKVLAAPFILVGVLAGAVIGSDGDTPDKLRSGAGRFNLLYTFLRGAEVGAVGAVIGAGLGGILLQTGLGGAFGWSVFVGFALGMIVGSIKPPNLAAYASYASASVKNVLVILMVAVALLFGLVVGVLAQPTLAPLLNPA